MTLKRTNTYPYILYLAIFLGVFSFPGCDSKDYMAQKSFEKVCWSYTDGLDFTLEVKDQISIPLLLQFTPDYAYQNIYLKLVYADSEGTTKEALLNQELSDKLGNWKTEWKGGLYTFELPKAFQVQVSSPGTYRCSITQYMREDNLCGIEKIGVINP